MSTGAYRKKVEEAQALLNDRHTVSYVGSWNRHPRLIAAIVRNIHEGLRKFPPAVRSTVTVLFTAHSLPERIVAMNDPYPTEVSGTVAAVTGFLDGQPTAFAYQSQGRSGERWLGPTVEATVEELARAGQRQVLVAPIGFLCDHVETLYDIDIELKQLATGRGIQLERIAMLNDSSPMIETLVDVIAAHESSLIPS
jgi:ferrochelatase